MAEVFNRAHPDIQKQRGTGVKSIATMTVMDRGRIRFTVAACQQFGIVKGKFIHFVEIGELWFFYVNDDPDGFPIMPTADKDTNAFRVTSKGFVEKFRERTKRPTKSTFYLQETKQTLQGNKLVEIFTDKTKEEILKRAKR